MRVLASMSDDDKDTFTKLPIEEQNKILKQHYSVHVKNIEILQKNNRELVQLVNGLQAKVAELEQEQQQRSTNDEQEKMESSGEEEEDDDLNSKNGQLTKRRILDQSNENLAIKKPRNGTSKEASPSKNANSVRESNSTSKPPAIIVFTKDVKKLSQCINNHLKNANSVLFMRRQDIKVQNFTKEDFESTKQLLTLQKMEFYTFTPKDEKPFTLLIKNIAEGFDEQEVQAAIIEKIEDINILNIKRFNERMMIIQLRDVDSANKVKKLRSLLGLGIIVTKYHGNNVLQCRNCQRYNHLATNCKMAYRCVKCAEGHGPNNCSIPKKDDNNQQFIVDNPDGTKTKQIGVKLKCANCGGEHAASFRQCPVRIKMMDEKNTQPSQQVTHQPNVRSPINTKSQKSNVSSYRDTLVSTNKSKVNFNLNNEIQSHFGKDLNICISKISNFLPRYGSLKTSDDKKIALFNLLFEICQN